MKILSIDPGGTTGWCTFEIGFDRNGAPLWNPTVAEHFCDVGQLTIPEHHNNLRKLMHVQNPDIIVCERFEKRQNDFSLLISVEYIGVVKQFAQQTNKTLVMQGASEALKWCSMDKMNILELALTPYQTWKDANAARKHLLYFLVHKLHNVQISTHILKHLSGRCGTPI